MDGALSRNWRTSQPVCGAVSRTLSPEATVGQLITPGLGKRLADGRGYIARNRVCAGQPPSHPFSK
jgi:hypothetical protein